ncbi:MAG: hypothetical protein U0640_08425 [Phycisphaerales bacterium]
MKLAAILIVLIASVSNLSFASAPRTINVTIRAVTPKGEPIPDVKFLIWCGQELGAGRQTCKASKAGIAQASIEVPENIDMFSVTMMQVDLSNEQVDALNGARCNIRKRIDADIKDYSVVFDVPADSVKITGRVNCSAHFVILQQTPTRYGDGYVAAEPLPGEHERTFVIEGGVRDKNGEVEFVVATGAGTRLFKVNPPAGAIEFDCGSLDCITSEVSGVPVKISLGDTAQGAVKRPREFGIMLISESGQYVFPRSCFKPESEVSKVPPGTYFVAICCIDDLGRVAEVVTSPESRGQLEAAGCPKIVVAPRETPDAGSDVPPAVVEFQIDYSAAWSAWRTFIDSL